MIYLGPLCEYALPILGDATAGSQPHQAQNSWRKSGDIH